MATKTRGKGEREARGIVRDRSALYRFSRETISPYVPLLSVRQSVRIFVDPVNDYDGHKRRIIIFSIDYHHEAL